jgi:hypothetical protein
MFVVLVLDGCWVSLPSGLPDGGQEVLDGRWVSLPSGLPRRRRNLQLRSMNSAMSPKPSFLFCRLAAKKNRHATRHL